MKDFKPSEKTIASALWACELLKRAYKNGEEDGGSIDWEDVNIAEYEATKALKLAKKEGYRED